MSLPDHRMKNFDRYLPVADGDGYLTYLNQGTLFAVAFDAEKLELHKYRL